MGEGWKTAFSLCHHCNLRVFLNIFLLIIALSILHPFVWPGRESCWLTGLQQSPPLRHAHASSKCLKRSPSFTIWGSTVRIPELPRYRMVQHHSTSSQPRIFRDFYILRYLTLAAFAINPLKPTDASCTCIAPSTLFQV